MSTTMRILQRTVEEDDAPIDDHKDVVLLGLFVNGWSQTFWYGSIHPVDVTLFIQKFG